MNKLRYSELSVEDCRAELYEIAAALRKHGRHALAARVQRVCDSLYAKGETIPIPLIPRTISG